MLSWSNHKVFCYSWYSQSRVIWIYVFELRLMSKRYFTAWVIALGIFRSRVVRGDVFVLTRRCSRCRRRRTVWRLRHSHSWFIKDFYTRSVFQHVSLSKDATIVRLFDISIKDNSNPKLNLYLYKILEKKTDYLRSKNASKFYKFIRNLLKISLKGNLIIKVGYKKKNRF